jgi:hypothetical protein
MWFFVFGQHFSDRDNYTEKFDGTQLRTRSSAFSSEPTRLPVCLRAKVFEGNKDQKQCQSAMSSSSAAEKEMTSRKGGRERSVASIDTLLWIGC